MKKILIILNDLNNGGVERVLSVIANHLAKNNYDVHVLAIATDRISYPLADEVKYEYEPIVKIYQKVGIVQELQTIKKIYKSIRRINPDCLIGFDDSIIIRSVPSAWLLRKRIIVSERIDPSIYELPMKIVRQIAYDMADQVVFQTPDAMAYFPKRIQKKGVVIPNPLTDDLPYRDINTNKDIIMACRLRPQKNVSLAIRAFADFHLTHTNYRLMVYGEGEQLTELKRLAGELNVGDAVCFPGHVDDIHEKMCHCAMYLSTSDYEGISNSMLEALAIGVPSICTDCPVGGARMFVESGVNGILVSVNDRSAVANAMRMIADDADLQNTLGRNGMKVRSKLAVSTICPQWERLIDE